MKKNEDIIKYILKKGDDLGYTFLIFTNGVELNHFLSDLSSVHIKYLQITLDGPQSLHDQRRIFKKGKGTFSTIVDNIEMARQLKIPVVVRTNTDLEILSRIDELAAFFKEKGWITDPGIYFSLIHLCDQRLNPEKVDQYLEIYQGVLDAAKRPEMHFFDASPFLKLHSLRKEHPKFWPSFWNCNAVSSRYVFDPFGDIYPCRSMVGWKEQRIGVYIPQLSFNEKHEQWRNRTIFAMKKCTECDLALVCGGGCGYVSLLEGDLFNPLCANIKQFVLPYLDYLSVHEEVL